MDILGIDIGTVSVKYVRWRGKKGKGSIVSEGDFQYKGDFEDLKLLTAEIREREGLNVELAVGLSSQEILKRTFTIPVLPKEEVKEAMNWAASKVVTSPIEEMYYEFMPVGDIDERGITKEEVFFVGAEKTYINELVGVFVAAGFKKIALLTDNSLVYIPYFKGEKEGSVAIIDIGGRQTGIYILDQGRPRTAREIMTASESFTDALISGFGFDYEKAEEYKKEQGFTDESSDILAVPFNRLTGEIQRTFDVYNQRYPDKPIKKIFFTGRGAHTPHFLEKAKETFLEETGFFPAPPEVGDEYFPAYALCGHKDTLENLLPPEIKQKEKEEKLGRWFRIATVAIAGILVILSMNIFGFYYKARMAVSSEETTLAKRREHYRSIGGTTVTSGLAQLLPLTNELQKRDVTFLMLLKYLSYQLPDGVYISGIDFIGEKKSTTEKASEKGTPSASTKEAIVAALKKGATLPGVAASAKDRYVVKIHGYVLGDVDKTEPILLGLVIAMEKSDFIRNTEISNKENIEIRGNKAIKFEIIGGCQEYEI